MSLVDYGPDSESDEEKKNEPSNEGKETEPPKKKPKFVLPRLEDKFLNSDPNKEQNATPQFLSILADRGKEKQAEERLHSLGEAGKTEKADVITRDKKEIEKDIPQKVVIDNETDQSEWNPFEILKTHEIEKKSKTYQTRHSIEKRKRALGQVSKPTNFVEEEKRVCRESGIY